MSNVKNYTEQGGDKWVINGTLEVTAEGQITIDSIAMNRAVAQANSEAATVEALKDDLNALIAKLKAAGLMAAS